MCFKTRGLYKCGKCPECLQERRLSWSLRLIQEFRETSCFSALLTYDSKYVPMTPDGMSVSKKDVQKFLKRLRHLFPHEKIKYYISAEYSPEKLRPHYHCLFFGLEKTSDEIKKGKEIKDRLEKAWGLGIIGSKSWWTKDDAQINYATNYLINLYEWKKDDKREKPFNLMSKGLGLEFHKEVFNIPDRYCNPTKYGWYYDFDKHRFVLNSPFYAIENPETKHIDIFIEDDFNLNLGTVSIQQTKFDYKKKITKLGNVKTFPMPRRWKEKCLTFDEREILIAVNRFKHYKNIDEYEKLYGEYDKVSERPMWVEQKLYRWAHKKKTKKDSLLSSPDAYL